MIRAGFLLVVIAGWLLFLQLEKKDRSQYLVDSLSFAPPNQPMSWNSDKLFFEGWSTPEATHRWSNTSRPTICFKAMRGPEVGHAGIAITVDADAVEPLVGRLISLHINEQIIEYRMTAAHQHVLRLENAGVVKNDLLCLRFKLPVTKNVLGDPRDLGLSFKGLHYNYFNDMTNSENK